MTAQDKDFGRGFGRPVRRVEDSRLVRGAGRFSDTVDLPGQAWAVIVRSPHAHARIRAIDTAPALSVPSVIAVLTGADYLADGLLPIPNNPVPPDLPLENRDGSPVVVPPDYPLAGDKVRHAGEGIALVIAETRAAAYDAAERVAVDYDILPAVVGIDDALNGNGAPVWDDAPRNVCVDADRGDPDATDAAIRGAAHVTRLVLHNNRVSGVPMEPAAAVAAHDAETGVTTLHAPGQGVLIQKKALCGIFGVEDDAVRVVCGDVGGGFGTRNLLYREHVLVCWATRRIGRPVKWRAERSESFLSDPYGRDITTTAELALDENGKFLAVRVHNVGNIGAQALHLVPLCRGAAVTNGVYVVPHIHARLQAVFTNTVPISTYRGAGRPESIFIIERLIDAAAAETGIDRFELRRRNFIEPAMLPWVSPLGTRYDSGEFATNMDRALGMADEPGIAERREAARARGRVHGFGIGNYIETATGIPFERAVVELEPERVRITLGTQASGQGHETSFAQVMVELLGVPFERVELRQGDTDFVLMGSGSHSSRSMRLGGLLLGRAAAEVVEKARPVAARALQAAPDELVFADGRFTVPDSERSVDLFDVAKLAADMPEDEHAALRASADITTMLPTFPNGCHCCEVEIDPDTGRIDVTRYCAVDDVGRIINPMLVDGQTHGSTAQGIGQALIEECVFDPESGQMLSGSFMDYAMPRADMLPSFVLANNEVPAPNNPLGIKGAGEGGTTGAPPAVVNAVVDALRAYGVTDVPMPMTPERVWRALRDARPDA